MTNNNEIFLLGNIYCGLPVINSNRPTEVVERLNRELEAGRITLTRTSGSIRITDYKGASAVPVATIADKVPFISEFNGGIVARPLDGLPNPLIYVEHGRFTLTTGA